MTVSIYSGSLDAHDKNRGLKGLTSHIERGLAIASSYPIFRIASVTVNRLIRFGCLAESLRNLGFQAATFSTREVSRWIEFTSAWPRIGAGEFFSGRTD